MDVQFLQATDLLSSLRYLPGHVVKLETFNRDIALGMALLEIPQLFKRNGGIPLCKFELELPPVSIFQTTEKEIPTIPLLRVPQE